MTTATETTVVVNPTESEILSFANAVLGIMKNWSLVNHTSWCIKLRHESGGELFCRLDNGKWEIVPEPVSDSRDVEVIIGKYNLHDMKIGVSYNKTPAQFVKAVESRLMPKYNEYLEAASQYVESRKQKYEDQEAAHKAIHDATGLQFTGRYCSDGNISIESSVTGCKLTIEVPNAQALAVLNAVLPFKIVE